MEGGIRAPLHKSLLSFYKNNFSYEINVTDVATWLKGYSELRCQ
jgi:hypothetical protein